MEQSAATWNSNKCDGPFARHFFGGGGIDTVGYWITACVSTRSRSGLPPQLSHTNRLPVIHIHFSITLFAVAFTGIYQVLLCLEFPEDS